VPVPSRPPWRVLLLSTTLALLAAGATYVLLSDDEPDDQSVVTLTPGEDLVPLDEVAFTTFDDEVVPLASLRGGPVLVNFFSSTCIPCITEMPAFEEVHQELGDQVTFLGLAVADRPADALALVEQTGVTYRTARDPDSAVITALGGTFLPTTVLLDAEGEIVARHAGELDADELRTLLRDALDVGS
jgi:cytochrome c biogenesis protein CcmG/thiol:disulfide interchange protein DsbE